MRNSRSTLVALALVSSALFVFPSLAATDPLEPPDPERYLRWGPLRVRPALRLSNLGYDDNILFRTAAKIGDYTATVSPEAEGLLLFGRRAFLTFTERLSHTVYLENGDQNFTENRFRSRVTLPLRSVGLFADVTIDDLKERPIDREDVRAERSDRGISAGLILRPGWRTEIEIARSATEL